ncbi:MAG: insulinase family protein [Clostridiales bacterium]|nr:insulinase family protein [Clostridiales bacterium]
MSRCINSSSELKNLSAYQLEYEEKLDDCKSVGLVFRHKKSKARICIVSNDDDNKVFMVGFRTPPKDSTGVAHIIEHTVLCGSRNFPVKDPFIELAKGSLNTFLNAMTYSDKTMYPIASCNDKDFQNLMHVYMDAVFYPNIYSHKEIFQQEGWHYELEDKDSDLGINGIVYSEMKGAFSSPESQLYREVQSSLFPDTPYGVESGGDPAFIPDLTYEDYMEFHRKYYSPANSYIYLYGNMDIEEKMNWLDDNYLSKFDEVKVDSVIPMQKAFEQPVDIVSAYSLSENESEEDNTYLTFNAVIGDYTDVEERNAMQVLEAVILSAPGAPLKQALIEAGIGKDILSSYDDELLQPTFNITAKNANVSDRDRFKQIIKDTLTKLVKDGLNEKSLLAAINVLEFRYREADYGQFPKGLLFGLNMMGTWLYDDSKAFTNMHGNEVFRKLREKIGTGYYEQLIQKYLIDNTHVTYLMLKPEKGLNAKKEEELRIKLQAYKESLTEEQKQEIIEATHNLVKYQETPSAQEDLEKIPLLSREDIEKKAPKLYNDLKYVDNVPVIHHNVFTNGIAYIKCMFDLSKVPTELISYVNLFSTVIGYIDTEDHTFSELANEMNIYTGGMNSDISIFNKRLDPDTYQTVLFIGTKVLYENIGKAFDIMAEMIIKSKFEDTKRLYEIIRETKSRIQMKLNSAGHNAAVDRAFSYITQSGYFSDLTKGIRAYQFLDELEKNFEDRKDRLVEHLRKLRDIIFTSKNCFVSITADEDGFSAFEKAFSQLKGKLDSDQLPENRLVENVICPADFKFPLEKKNEAFTYAGQVQYVARCGNYVREGFTTNGALKVLKMIMSYDYLWNNVRVKGGAYGCMCQIGGLDGSAYMVSYRDPNLAETDQIYKDAYKYVESFEASERDMTKYIIGTMSAVDTPLTPMMKGSRSLSAYMSGVTYDNIQRDRDQILATTQEDIRKYAPLVKAVMDEDVICVIGNAEKVNKDASMFGSIKPLF